MKVAIGADHRGVEIKRRLAEAMRAMGHEVSDCGWHGTEVCDYPDIAEAVARSVAGGAADRGILLCMSGIGMCIAANKVSGVRAGLCHTVESARLSRQHNDANVLVLAAGNPDTPMEEIIAEWLKTPFEGGRHQRRVDKISTIEKKQGG